MQTCNNPIVSAARLCLAAIVLGIACVPMQSVSARPHAQDFVVNPAAEQYLLSGLVANGYADLADAFPDESQRVVGADFFIGALNHPDVQSKQNIYIGNTVIVGYVNALAARIPYTLFLNVVTFTDYVNFSDSEINSLTVFDASFYQGVEFQGISAKELDLRNDIFYYGINLYGVEIGELTFVENQVLGTEPMREGIAFPSEFRRMNVSSVADFSGTYFEGAAVFEESEFHTLLMWNMQFAGEADFRKVLVERTGEFVGTEFLQGADFTESSLGSASFEGAHFAGAVFFTGCSVNGDLSFDGATFSASGPPADLSHMDVADTTWLNDIYTAAGLDLSYGSFKNLRISAGAGSAIPSLLLVEAEISGQFAIKDSQIGDLNVSGMKNDGTATLDNVAITE
ncbi:MAG: pentapeptide repeat-containing protein, partial [Chloroflexota bacterium]